MKSTVGILILIASVISLKAQDQPAFDGKNWQPPYLLATPQHWEIERFLIPIAFAPSIPYKGVEDIRFAPGWSKKDSEEYWAYTFLWYLDGKVELDVKTIEKNLSAYYTGLLYANYDSTKNKVKITPATVVAKKVTGDKKSESAFEATVNTLDYMTWQPFQLNVRIHTLTCLSDNKTFVFHQVSPKPYSHTVWNGLYELWKSLQCKK